MKNFRVKIHAYNYSTEFNISALDTPQDIEKAILDKVGQKDVKWEKDGFTGGKWITYEEVINDPRPIHSKEVLGVRVATGASERG